MRPGFARTAIVLSVALVAVSCSKPLDIGGLETQLANDMNTRFETTGITVDCPNDVKAQSGSRFECTGRVSTGETLTIRVTQTDGSGKVTWEVVGAPSPSASPSSSA